MVEIKKLPPGKAQGADDLHYWAKRRLGGKCGVGEKDQTKRKLDKADKWLARHDPRAKKGK